MKLRQILVSLLMVSSFVCGMEHGAEPLSPTAVGGLSTPPVSRYYKKVHICPEFNHFYCQEVYESPTLRKDRKSLVSVAFMCTRNKNDHIVDFKGRQEGSILSVGAYREPIFGSCKAQDCIFRKKEDSSK